MKFFFLSVQCMYEMKRPHRGDFGAVLGGVGEMGVTHLSLLRPRKDYSRDPYMVSQQELVLVAPTPQLRSLARRTVFLVCYCSLFQYFSLNDLLAILTITIPLVLLLSTTSSRLDFVDVSLRILPLASMIA